MEEKERKLRLDYFDIKYNIESLLERTWWDRMFFYIVAISFGLLFGSLAIKFICICT